MLILLFLTKRKETTVLRKERWSLVVGKLLLRRNFPAIEGVSPVSRGDGTCPITHALGFDPEIIGKLLDEQAFISHIVNAQCKGIHSEDLSHSPIINGIIQHECRPPCSGVNHLQRFFLKLLIILNRFRELHENVASNPLAGNGSDLGTFLNGRRFKTYELPNRHPFFRSDFPPVELCPIEHMCSPFFGGCAPAQLVRIVTY